MSDDLAPIFERHLRTLEVRLEYALAAAGLDGLILHAGTPPKPPWDDQPYPHRVHPLFAQWCPQPDAAGATLVLEPGHRPRLVLVRSDDFWHAPAEEPETWWAAPFDVDYVAASAARKSAPAGNGRRFASIGAAADGNGPNDAKAVVVQRHLDYERAGKTDFEIECISRANAIAAAGHMAVAALFAEGVPELELDFEFLRASRQRPYDLPYPSIVALNEHAAVLHYQHLERIAPPAALTLLVDAGARYSGYAADITRTHLAGGSALGELHESVESMQQQLCAEAVAGVEFTALNDRAHQRLAEILTSHGLVRASAAVAYESGITRVFLPHGLGHLLGLQVHDPAGHQRAPLGAPTSPPPEHPHLRLTRRLERGFVVTIEPGIYFIESLRAALPSRARALIDGELFEALRLAGGIRIEDDVAVEAGDNRNLTREAFLALEQH